jgi:serine/threonine protein kinase
MRGPLFVLSALATVSVFYYVSRIESFMSLKSNLRAVSNDNSQSFSSFQNNMYLNEISSEIIDNEQPQRRLVVVHDAEGLRASLLPERLNLASSWDILLECRNPMYISTPLVIPSYSDIRISSPYWSNPPMIIARDATRIFSMESDSVLELSNVQLSSGVANEGGAVYNDGGKLSLSGCNLLNHTAHERGGAIFSKNGEVKLENTTFTGCVAGDAGGGIFVSSASEMKRQKKHHHHEHGRKLVSFSRVAFESNIAPFGADFILGEHETYESSKFINKLFHSSWFHLFMAALLGGVLALTLSSMLPQISALCHKHFIISPKNFLHSSFNSLSSSSSSSLLSSSSSSSSSSLLHHHHAALESNIISTSQQVNSHNNYIDDDDYDIEMLSSSSTSYQATMESIVQNAKSTVTIINPHNNQNDFNVNIVNKNENDVDVEDQEEEEEKNDSSRNLITQSLSNILSTNLFINLKDMFRMTLVARGAHSSVYRAVVKTNGKFGILPPLNEQQASSLSFERVIAVKRLTYDFKKGIKKHSGVLTNGVVEPCVLNEEDEAFIRQWHDESEIMASLTPHANVLGLIAIIADHDNLSLSRQDNNSPFGLGLVLEWMPGSLRDALDAGLLPPRPPTMQRGYEEDELSWSQHHHQCQQQQPPLTLLSSRVTLDITKGLKHLHENNVVHRDLKATNIMLDQYGRAKLSDFGIAVFQQVHHPSSSSSSYQQSNQLSNNMRRSLRLKTHHETKKRPVGTLLYAAPELLKQEGLWNKKTSVDIWALGMVVVEIYAGMPLLHLWRRSSEKEATSHHGENGNASLSRQVMLGAGAATSTSSSSPFGNSLGTAGRLPNMLQACGWRPDLRELNLARESLGGLLNQSWSYSPQERPNVNEFLIQLEMITQPSLTQRQKSQKSSQSSSSNKMILPSSSSSSSSMSTITTHPTETSASSSASSLSESSTCSSPSLSSLSSSPSVNHHHHSSNILSLTKDGEYSDESLTTESFSPSSSLSEDEEPSDHQALSSSLVITSQPGNTFDHEDPPYANAAALYPNITQELQHQIMLQEEEDMPNTSIMNHHEESSSSSSTISQFNDAWGGWFSRRNSSQGDIQTLLSPASRLSTPVTSDEPVPDLEPLAFD